MWNGKWTVFGSFRVSLFSWYLSKQQTKAAMSLMAWEGWGACTTTRGVYEVFRVKKKKISIELILNAALSAACLLPHWKVRRGEGKGTGQAKQGDYNSIKLPSGPASHWLTFALTFALLVIARAARCRPLPVWGLVSPGKRVAQPPFNPSPCYHPLDWGPSAVFVMPQ